MKFGGKHNTTEHDTTNDKRYDYGFCTGRRRRRRRVIYFSPCDCVWSVRGNHAHFGIEQGAVVAQLSIKLSSVFCRLFCSL